MQLSNAVQLKMTIISKELYENVLPNGLKCSEGHIWHRFCLESIQKFSVLTFYGSLKFFVPIYIVKLLLNYKKVHEKNFLKNSFLEWIRSGLYGCAFGTLVNSSWCLSTHILNSGSLSYYQVGLVPGFVSGLSLLLESSENQKLDTLIFFNLVLEALINNLLHNDAVNLSPMKLTFFFMVSSGLLMGLMEGFPAKLPKVNFWFYKPKSSEKGCNHSGNCKDFMLKGLKNYFLLGYMVNIIRNVIPKMMVLLKHPQIIPKLLFNQKNIKWGLLFGGYVTIYRFLGCRIFSDFLPDHLRGFLCGFISGGMFRIAPNLQLLIISLSTLLQLVYMNLTRKFNIPKTDFQRQFLFMVCNGILMHNTIFNQVLTPKYYVNMLNIVSLSLLDKVYEEVVGKILKRIFV